jgi:transcription-repair coupling factor (superfamily II helicase)
LLALSRDIAERGYERTHFPERQGEFTVRGGSIIIAPLNTQALFQIEFHGNTVEEITKLARRPLPFVPQEAEEEASRPLHFRAGDFVVHQDHGIGVFRGTRPDLLQYYEIEYAAGDKLYVPFSQARKLSLYLGFSRPRVTRLGGNLWARIRRKTKEDVLRFAKELLEHYKKREHARGFPFAKDGPETAELIESFEYPETPDQKRAWEEIRTEMEKQRPMEHLLVGDVGFGKTELAVRAAFKAVLSGKQAVLIAPTTVLSWQHFETFQERLSAFGVRIALFSRLERPEVTRENLQLLKEGKIDIALGTHRLLSKDIHFKDLGLLIVDEEQRFGVKQKEKLTMLKENLDVLMLSATPIPRTLSAALAGIKSISRLETPPLGRQSIETHVQSFDWRVVTEAIGKEVARGGQVFFLENRIGRFKIRLEELNGRFPDFSVGMLHGKMSEQMIVETLHDFRHKKYQVLVATTIIENGLHLPNVNTLIVADGTRLGLAQAHQLRGRIGRGEKKAAAYFFYPGVELAGRAKMRLEALTRYASLGAGYEIALEDLRLRGAGNILGKEQSGHINNVGLHLYLEMLHDTLAHLRPTS